MRQRSKKLWSVLLSLALLLSLLPGLTLTAYAAVEPVAYLEASVEATTHAVSFTEKTCSDYTIVSDSTVAVTWDAGWYVVSRDANVSGRITVSGTANLILCNGVTLTAPKGISVKSGNTLNIYAQSNDKATMGAIISEGVEGSCAGIGSNAGESGGTVYIHGGKITAKGGQGNSAQNGGAGIGSGSISGTSPVGNGSVTIYGGEITATGGQASNNRYGGPGIGGGSYATGGSVTIYGGKINATGGGSAQYGGAGIGGGYKATGGNVTIYGGEITAKGGDGGAGIGGGSGTPEGNGTVTIHGGKITATGGKGAGIGGGASKSGYVTIDGGDVTAIGGSGAGIGGGSYGDGGTVTIGGGDVTATGGSGAGIGGGSSGGGGTVTIGGGTVTANGGSYGAGIGGGDGGVGSAVTITGGTVKASGGSYGGMGIGAGDGNTNNGSLKVANAYAVWSDAKNNVTTVAENIAIDAENVLDGKGTEGTEVDMSGFSRRYMLVTAGPAPERWPLWVSGQRVYANNVDDVLGNADTGETVKFTPADDSTDPVTPATLTLNGASITKGHENSGIYYSGTDPLSIVLAENSVNSIKGDFSQGIMIKDTSVDPADVTISGTGSLTITGAGSGISATGDVTINGGEVSAYVTGNNADGIFADHNVTITGGKVTAKRTAASDGNSGICASADLTISGGIVESSGFGFGLYAGQGDVYITGGDVTASGSNAGILANNGGAVIKGGNVTVSGVNNRAFYSSNGEAYTPVKNTIPGIGWTDVEGIAGMTGIDANPDGQKLTFKKVQFFAPHTHAGQEINFQPWISGTGLPTAAGSYFLTQDVTLPSTWSVPTGTTNLCLNGHKITYTGTTGTTQSVVEVPENAYLNLFDCATTPGAITGGKGTYVKTGGKYGYYYGGGVLVDGGTFHMYGGTISGNTAGDSSGGNGGGVAVIYNGSFTMSDGTITENTANRPTTGGGGMGHGGGVFVSLGGSFTMNGGSISGNTGRFGAVSLLDDATCVISDGTIEAYDESQAIHTNGANGSFNLTVSGGVVDGGNGNPSISIQDDTNGTYSSFTLSGSPRIIGAVKLQSGPNITVEDYRGSQISVDRNKAGVFTSGCDFVNDAAAQVVFTSVNPAYIVAADANHEAQLVALYPLWVGETRVNSVNMYDVLGDATVVFTPAKGNDPATLTLKNAKITTAYNYIGNAYAGIYYAGANTALKINGSGILTVTTPTGGTNTNYNGIYAYSSNLEFDGNFSITAPYYGVATSGGSITVSSGILTVNGASAINAGIGLTIQSGSKVIANAPNGTAVSAFVNGLIPNGVEILEPVGGIFDTTNHYVVDKDSKRATYVVIAPENTSLYFVEVDTDIINGNVTADRIYTVEGDVVGLTVSPASGYVLDALTVTDADGTRVRVTDDNTFTMPASDVTVSATFKQQSGGGIYGGGSSATYKVILPAQTAGGKLTVSPEKAAKGDKVTITATPDEGYKAIKPTVTDADGKTVELTENADGTWTFTMPGSDATVSGGFEKTGTDRQEKFVDVPADAWYHDDVYWAVDKGVTTGVDDTHFAPDADCTRAQFVTFLWRAAGKPAPASTVNPFEDVKADAYYYEAVLWAVEKGVTKGTDATHFSPDAPVTRAEAMTFLYRYEQTLGKGFTGLWAFQLDYADADDVPDWAYEAFCWMVKEDICKGADGKLEPGALCPRCQVVALLARIFAA